MFDFLDAKQTAGSNGDGSVSQNAASSETCFGDRINGSIGRPKKSTKSNKSDKSNKSLVPAYYVLNTEIQGSPFNSPLVDPPDELTYYLLSLKPSLERLKADRDLLEETKMEIQKLIFDKSKLLSNKNSDFLSFV